MDTRKKIRDDHHRDPLRVSAYLRLRNVKRWIAERVIRFAHNEFEKSRVRENTAKCVLGDRSVLYSGSKIDNAPTERQRITIGTDTQVLSNLQVFPHGGRISIGNHCYLGEQSKLWSMESIEVGDRVLISHGVNIHDHNAHSLSAADRHRHLSTIVASGHPRVLEHVRTAPVVIEDDAWIGFNATVLKGVRVGRGAIVGACSVVTETVPPFAIVVGNPARVVASASP